MAELTKEKSEREKPPRRRLRTFLIFFVTLAAVLGVVVVAAYRDGTGFDALRRFLSYGNQESDSTGFTYDASASNRFAVLGDKLAVLSDTQLQVLSGGKDAYSKSVKMSQPALASGGGSAVAWDVGGTELHVVNRDGEQLALTAEENEPFISATLNSAGWLAVTAQKANYKGVVSVYDDKMQLVFTFNSSQRFVTDAYVTNDCKYLAAVTLGQEDSVFVSNIILYNLTNTKPVANYDVKDGLALTIGQVDSEIATVCDTNLTFGTISGKVTATYDYSGEYLREYDLSGDGCAVLMLGRYKSGSMGRLVTVGSDGKEIASLDVNDEVLSVSASGRYIAVLYADRCVIYTQQLKEYATRTGTDYAKSVLMRRDGTALLIASGQATLFLP